MSTALKIQTSFQLRLEEMEQLKHVPWGGGGGPEGHPSESPAQGGSICVADLDSRPQGKATDLSLF